MPNDVEKYEAEGGRAAGGGQSSAGRTPLDADRDHPSTEEYARQVVREDADKKRGGRRVATGRLASAIRAARRQSQTRAKGASDGGPRQGVAATEQKGQKKAHSRQGKDAKKRPAACPYLPDDDQPAFRAPARTKDHVVAGLLALFLGALGMHKFYLGYTNAGFMMMGVSVCLAPFTFGVSVAAMFVVGVVEGVLYLSMGQSEFESVYVRHAREWL